MYTCKSHANTEVTPAETISTLQMIQNRHISLFYNQNSTLKQVESSIKNSSKKLNISENVTAPEHPWMST